MKNRIKALREAAKMTQAQLGQKIKVGNTAISMYESGSRQLDPDTICQLCDLFDCTADYLLGRSSSPDVVISDDDASVLYAYHTATPEIRAIVDAALAPYRKGGTMSSTA